MNLKIKTIRLRCIVRLRKKQKIFAIECVNINVVEGQKLEELTGEEIEIV